MVRFDGSKGSKDFRIKDKAKAVYYRYGEGAENLQMAMGTLNRAPNADQIEDFYSAEVDDGSVTIITDPVEMYVNLMERLKRSCGFAIWDDNKTWEHNGQTNKYGKLLLVDRADLSTQHIFFDDNAHPGERCQIDVRDVITGEEIPYRKAIGKYIARVESHRAILESDYFVKMIESCENKMDEDIEKMEKGVYSDEEAKDEQEEGEFEKLHGAPNEEYLIKTVMPILYQVRSIF